MTKQFVGILLLGFTLSFLFSGCETINKALNRSNVDVEKDGEITVGDGQGNTVNLSGDGTTFTGEDGDSTVKVGEDLDLPDGYPKNLVPLMDDANIETALASESGGKKSFWVMYTSKKSVKEAADFYKKALGDIEDKYTWDDSKTFTLGGQKDGQQIGIIVSDNEGQGSTVNISIE